MSPAVSLAPSPGGALLTVQVRDLLDREVRGDDLAEGIRKVCSIRRDGATLKSSAIGGRDKLRILAISAY